METDLKKVKQSKVKKFVLRYGLDNSLGFRKMKTSCYNPLEESSYLRHHQTYLIESNIESVWKAYTTIHPKEAWNSEMVSFGLQYSKNDNAISYLDDPSTGIEKGQIIILNLKLLWGLINIAVAHKVADINQQDRVIKLCYMEGGASEGSQWIRLNETKEGFTEVSHLTLYRSKSPFRDKTLYPPLHTKAINEFHVNVKRKAELLTK
jgi:hypothetical protein